MKKLKSTDEILDESFWTNEWDGTGDEIANLLTQDRNQAYTSLVEGIKAQVKDINGEGSVFDDFATDIIENVVKPLYNKTRDNKVAPYQ